MKIKVKYLFKFPWLFCKFESEKTLEVEKVDLLVIDFIIDKICKINGRELLVILDISRYEDSMENIDEGLYNGERKNFW